MTDLVYIPAFLNIVKIPNKRTVLYQSIEELKEKLKTEKEKYFLIIYESCYHLNSDIAKNSFATILVSFDCDFEQIDHKIFRVNGEKLTKFALEQTLPLIETALSLYDRIIENLQIGISLTVEKKADNLYSNILTFLRKATKAEAGTLYLMSAERDKIYFISSQNARFDSKMIEKKEIPFNKQSLVGYVCHKGETLNIANAYDIPEDVPYEFNKEIDKKLNYKTVSIITVPMKTTTGEVVGAVQLINKIDEKTKKESPFSDFDEMMLMSLATLAAVTVENHNLLVETETLLNNMIISSVKAIEQRDPATKGHSLRVAALTVELLKIYKKKESKKFNIEIDDNLIKTAEIAALLHDFGKVGVREKILMKEGRIYSEQLEAVKWRMRFIIASLSEEDERLKVVKEIFQKIDSLNIPRPHTDEEKGLIEKAGELTFEINGEEIPIFTEEELGFLKIRSGTFNTSERADMEKHVVFSYDLLNSIEWSRHLKSVPEIAASHHEKLDGSGYPFGKKGEDLGIIERILGVVDIYDALTAKDRPYKKAMPTEVALSIIEKEVASGKLDSEIFELLSKNWKEIEDSVKKKMESSKFN
ncbi:MAG: HD domain-containing phosphohydrolase [bacterium]